LGNGLSAFDLVVFAHSVLHVIRERRGTKAMSIKLIEGKKGKKTDEVIDRMQNDYLVLRKGGGQSGESLPDARGEEMFAGKALVRGKRGFKKRAFTGFPIRLRSWPRVVRVLTTKDA